MEIVITGGFHDVNLVEEILLHRLIDQTTYNILRTENVQQTNRTVNVFVILTHF